MILGPVCSEACDPRISSHNGEGAYSRPAVVGGGGGHIVGHRVGGGGHIVGHRGKGAALYLLTLYVWSSPPHPECRIYGPNIHPQVEI